MTYQHALALQKMDRLCRVEKIEHAGDHLVVTTARGQRIRTDICHHLLTRPVPVISQAQKEMP